MRIRPVSSESRPEPGADQAPELGAKVATCDKRAQLACVDHLGHAELAHAPRRPQPALHPTSAVDTPASTGPRSVSSVSSQS